MKAYYAGLSILCLILAQPLYPQIDVTFPNVSATSTIIWGCMHPDGTSSTVTETFTYNAAPADTIDDLIWGTLLLSSSPIGKIAVEGSKVWYRGLQDYGCYLCVVPPIDTAIILYDFDLQVGDTAYFHEFWFLYNNTQPKVVTSVDTIMIEGQQRRLLEISNEQFWLEGIGGLNGILSPFYGTGLGCGFDSNNWCADYMDENEIEYTFCSDIVLADVDHVAPSTVIFPNPCRERFTIQADAPIGDLRLFDTAGRSVMAIYSNSNNSTIEVGSLVPGIYFLSTGDRTYKLMVE